MPRWTALLLLSCMAGPDRSEDPCEPADLDVDGSISVTDPCGRMAELPANTMWATWQRCDTPIGPVVRLNYGENEEQVSIEVFRDGELIARAELDDDPGECKVGRWWGYSGEQLLCEQLLDQGLCSVADTGSVDTGSGVDSAPLDTGDGPGRCVIEPLGASEVIDLAVPCTGLETVSYAVSWSSWSFCETEAGLALRLDYRGQPGFSESKVYVDGGALIATARFDDVPDPAACVDGGVWTGRHPDDLICTRLLSEGSCDDMDTGIVVETADTAL